MKPNKAKSRARPGLAVIGCLFILALSAGYGRADIVQVHGFGGWGYGHTFTIGSKEYESDHTYSIATGDGSFANSYFALNVSASPYERFNTFVQTLWRTSEKGLEMEFDYAFAEWEAHDLLKLRIGKVKSPFGIYSEIYDVGTLRPFYTPPQGVYGVPGLVTESYFGIGLTGSLFPSSGWGFQYDLYGGEYILKTHEVIYAEGANEPIFQDMVGLRLIAHTPLSGLSGGFSLYGGNLILKSDGEEPEDPTVSDWHNTYGAHVEYLTDAWLVRAEYEYLHKWSGEDMAVNGAYVEAAYKIASHWQAAAGFGFYQIEFYSFETPPNMPTNHREGSVGLNYWFNPNFVLKLSYYLVSGNLFAQPEDPVDFIQAMYADTLEEITNAVIFGTQFSF